MPSPRCFPGSPGPLRRWKDLPRWDGVLRGARRSVPSTTSGFCSQPLSCPALQGPWLLGGPQDPGTPPVLAHRWPAPYSYLDLGFLVGWTDVQSQAGGPKVLYVLDGVFILLLLLLLLFSLLGIESRTFTLSYVSGSFLFFILRQESLSCPGWARTLDPAAPASCRAGITGVRLEAWLLSVLKIGKFLSLLVKP